MPTYLLAIPSHDLIYAAAIDLLSYIYKEYFCGRNIMIATKLIKFSVKRHNNELITYRL